jgi:hypothetical protein
MMILYTWKYVGIIYLNCFQFLLKFLVPDGEDFTLFLTILHLQLPILIEVLVGKLKKDERHRTLEHTNAMLHVRHTSPIPKCTQKFPTVKEEKLNPQHFRSNVPLITDTATGSTVNNLGSIHERARYLPLLHTMTGSWAT